MSIYSDTAPVSPDHSEISDETKECTRCAESKLLDEFPKHTRTRDGRDSWCRDCNNRGRKPTRARMVRNRARQRATAELIELHRDEFDRLLDRQMEYVSDEFEVVRSTAKTQRDQDVEVPRLKPGPKRVGEEVADRVQDARCSQCAKAHDVGHRCPSCGMKTGVVTLRKVGSGIDPAALAEFNAGTERARNARRSS